MQFITQVLCFFGTLSLKITLLRFWRRGSYCSISYTKAFLIMYEYKQFFSQIGSRNEYIKIAVFLIFVSFLLFPILGKKAAVIIGAVALLSFCLGVVFWLRSIAPKRNKNGS